MVFTTICRLASLNSLLKKLKTLVYIVQYYPIRHVFVTMQSKIMSKCAGEFLYTFLEEGAYTVISQGSSQNTKIHFPSVFSIFMNHYFHIYSTPVEWHFI